MLNIIPIPAFNDNYIWCGVLTSSNAVFIVDPGDAKPVLRALKERQLQLQAILLTHHHFDHTGGVAEILAEYNVPVFGPQHDNIASLTNALVEHDTINIPKFNLDFSVLEIPAHTRGHIAFHGHDVLFCGDTLFTGGCGRLFEGSAAQMYASLQKLAQLSDSTQVYCGHEYTLHNLEFALQLEPNNPALQQRYATTQKLRQQNLPTVPAPLSLEKQTNPFLRCYIPAVKQAAEQHCGHSLNTPVDVLAVIRAWKDNC